MDPAMMQERVVARFRERLADEDRANKLVALFDSLRPNQKISVAMTSVMGSSEATDGEPHDWLVGRRSKGRNYETITLMPVDGSWKPNKYNAFKLWKQKSRHDDSFYISASHGDMGLMLKSINGIRAERTAARKPEVVTKRDWPETWGWILEAHNFLSGEHLPRSTDHIIALQGGRKRLFQEALKRFEAEVSPRDLEDLKQMSPGIETELEQAKRMTR